MAAKNQSSSCETSKGRSVRDGSRAVFRASSEFAVMHLSRCGSGRQSPSRLFWKMVATPERQTDRCRHSEPADAQAITAELAAKKSLTWSVLTDVTVPADQVDAARLERLRNPHRTADASALRSSTRSPGDKQSLTRK